MARIREAGDAMLVAELGEAIDTAINRRAIGMASRVRAANVAGVRDVLPTFRSVAVTFDPLRTDLDELRALLQPRPDDGRFDDRPPLEIPVEYGGDAGPDLESVAEASGLSVAEVIGRHASRDYRVFMVGFLPGFAYLGAVDSSIVARRHASPRLRVPPGSVGIAGQQTGVYPQGSPGGWQIVGRTTWRPFDAGRMPASLLAPGDSVRFVAVPPGSLGSFDAAWATPASRGADEAHGPRTLRVLQPGLLTTVQDAGRWGRQHEGVPVSGAMDASSLGEANCAVGNPRGAAALEVTLGGLELRLEHAGALAVAGGDLDATIDGRRMSHAARVEHQRGSVVRFGARRTGARAYLAFEGGLDAPLCMGSRSTDLTTAIGGWHGRRLRAGDCVPVGQAAGPATASAPPAPRTVHQIPSGGARVRVLPGPHDDWFPSAAIEVLRRTRYEVTSESNRMGYRLRGPHPLPRETGEMISDATCAGGLQVPPSGQPILLMADRQVTGGYPIVATVISADLPVVGQLAPGDWIEFEPCTRGEAVAALARLESHRDRLD
jgi:KipI family sensor histidine kinase inhibitor